MIRRAWKEIWADKGIVTLGIIFCTVIGYILSISQISEKSCESCSMDAFAWSSRTMQSSIYIITMLVIVGISKNDYRPERVIRQQYTESLWLHSVIKTGILSAVFSLVLFFITLISGLCMSKDFCNWEKETSYYYYVTGSLITDVDYRMIFFTYVAGSFLGICVSALFPLLLRWLFGNYIFGVIIMMMINLMGDIEGYVYDTKRDVFFYNLWKGIDIRYQFIYPCAIIAFLCLVGLSKKKKDFLNKREMG